MFQSAVRQDLVESALAHLKLPSGITIRAWTEADCHAILQLLKSEGWPVPTEGTRHTFAAWRQSWPALIATHGENVVGILRAITDGIATTCVAEMVVAAEWRCRGIGTALIETCHLLYPKTKLELVAEKINEAFCEAKGFSRILAFRKSFDGER